MWASLPGTSQHTEERDPKRKAEGFFPDDFGRRKSSARQMAKGRRSSRRGRAEGPGVLRGGRVRKEMVAAVNRAISHFSRCTSGLEAERKFLAECLSVG